MSLVDTKHLISSTELAEITGATFRQIDWWERGGVIRPAIAARGPGRYRSWDSEIVPLVRLLATVSQSLEIGDTRVHRQIVDRFEVGELDLGGGVRLVWDPDQLGAA